jgi:hypothetical protein
LPSNLVKYGNTDGTRPGEETIHLQDLVIQLYYEMPYYGVKTSLREEADPPGVGPPEMT